MMMLFQEWHRHQRSHHSVTGITSRTVLRYHFTSSFWLLIVIVLSLQTLCQQTKQAEMEIPPDCRIMPDLNKGSARFVVNEVRHYVSNCVKLKDGIRFRKRITSANKFKPIGHKRQPSQTDNNQIGSHYKKRLSNGKSLIFPKLGLSYVSTHKPLSNSRLSSLSRYRQPDWNGNRSLTSSTPANQLNYQHGPSGPHALIKQFIPPDQRLVNSHNLHRQTKFSKLPSQARYSYSKSTN